MKINKLFILSILLLGLVAVWWGKTAVSAAPVPALRRIPPAMNSQEANGDSRSPQMSANGRYIIFATDWSSWILRRRREWY